jgi:hydroxyethylthiazole kinase-like uncharacterized protein yjeF
VIVVDATVLHELPIPGFRTGTSKDDRGSVLIIGGSRETPGGVLLAGEAALRAGAGRLVLATVRSVAPSLSIAVPEARVVALPETGEGAICPTASETLCPHIEACDVMAIGPGAMDSDATGDLLTRLIPNVPRSTTALLDAAAIPVLGAHPDLIDRLAGDAVVAPNPTEMARLLGRDEEAVCKDPELALIDALELLPIPVALRGEQTWMSAPGESKYIDHAGIPALATAGSGDVAVGALAGLLARGAAPLRAMLWAVHTHAMAGRMLAGSGSGVGLLARDLLDRLPIALASLESS